MGYETSAPLCLDFSARSRTWIPPGSFPKLGEAPHAAHMGSIRLAPCEDSVQLSLNTAGDPPWAVQSTPSVDHTTEKEDRLRLKVLVSVSCWPGQNPEHPLLEGLGQWENQMHILHQAQTHAQIPETGLVGRTSYQLALRDTMAQWMCWELQLFILTCLTTSFHEHTLPTRALALWNTPLIKCFPLSCRLNHSYRTATSVGST